MAVIAVFNQKGGVGKTTTVLNLLGALVQRGERPIGIDMDPQAHLSGIMGGAPPGACAARSPSNCSRSSARPMSAGRRSPRTSAWPRVRG